jgi:glutathione S-transferase
MTPQLKLTYFHMPVRVELSLGKVPFEDVRIAPSSWGALKPKTPLVKLPVLEVDGGHRSLRCQAQRSLPRWRPCASR